MLAYQLLKLIYLCKLKFGKVRERKQGVRRMTSAEHKIDERLSAQATECLASAWHVAGGDWFGVGSSAD